MYPLIPLDVDELVCREDELYRAALALPLALSKRCKNIEQVWGYSQWYGKAQIARRSARFVGGNSFALLRAGACGKFELGP